MAASTVRAMTSVLPPAAKGTITRIGRSGQAARAGCGSRGRAASAPSRARRVVIGFLRAFLPASRTIAAVGGKLDGKARSGRGKYSLPEPNPASLWVGTHHASGADPDK